MGEVGSRRAWRAASAVLLLVLGGLVSWVSGGNASAAGGLTVTLTATPASAGISKIKHVIVIMQENRSFDHYFGMYPGADGIPVDGHGAPTVCVNDPATNQCVYPWHDPSDVSNGGPHDVLSANNDVNGGAMDGFIAEYETALKRCLNKPGNQNCGVPKPQPDVMSYKLRSDLPEYWAYADNYVLQDHMFGPGADVESRRRICTWFRVGRRGVIGRMTRRVVRTRSRGRRSRRYQSAPNYRVDRHHASAEPARSVVGLLRVRRHRARLRGPRRLTCIPLPQSHRTRSIWNPLPYFDTVAATASSGTSSRSTTSPRPRKNGTLPAVSWVVPTDVGQRAPAGEDQRRRNVRDQHDQRGHAGPDWDSTAIFLAWDDWGGFYDHVVPADRRRQRLRHPRARPGDQPVREAGLRRPPDAAASTRTCKFIEDVFLGGQRLDPTTDGRPDPRPVVGKAPASPTSRTTSTSRRRPGRRRAGQHQRRRGRPADPSAAPRPSRGSVVRHRRLRIGNGRSPSPLLDRDQYSGPAISWAVRAARLRSRWSSIPPAPRSPAARRSPGGRSTSATALAARGTGPPSIQTHVYAAPGSYTANTRVTSSTGLTCNDTALVTVNPALRMCGLWATSPSVSTRSTTTFDVSQSSPGNWTIKFGDAKPDLTGTGVPPSAVVHHFDHVGTFTTTLTVTDPTSGLSNVAVCRHRRVGKPCAERSHEGSGRRPRALPTCSPTSGTTA